MAELDRYNHLSVVFFSPTYDIHFYPKHPSRRGGGKIGKSPKLWVVVFFPSTQATFSDMLNWITLFTLG